VNFVLIKFTIPKAIKQFDLDLH